MSIFAASIHRVHDSVIGLTLARGGALAFFYALTELYSLSKVMLHMTGYRVDVSGDEKFCQKGEGVFQIHPHFFIEQQKNNQKMIFYLEIFCNNQKIIYICSVERQKAMFNMMNGLKAREEMLETLRFLFRHEEQLKKEGWYSDSEFFEAVIQTLLEGVEEMLKE